MYKIILKIICNEGLIYIFFSILLQGICPSNYLQLLEDNYSFVDHTNRSVLVSLTHSKSYNFRNEEYHFVTRLQTTDLKFVK